MSSNMSQVKPFAVNWVESTLSAIYAAPTTEAFDDAFSKFCPPGTLVTVNNQTLTVDEYKGLISKERLVSLPAEVKYLDNVEVVGPTLTTGSTINISSTTSTAGVFYKVDVSKPVSNTLSVQSTVTSSINAVVQQTVTPFGPPPIIGFTVKTEITFINQVTVEVADTLSS